MMSCLSGSPLFSNSAIFILGVLKVNMHSADDSRNY